MSINGRGENVGNAYITHIGEQVVRLPLLTRYITIHYATQGQSDNLFGEIHYIMVKPVVNLINKDYLFTLLLRSEYL